MNTFEFALDLSKQTAMEPLRLRQGDKNGTEVRATIYDHGTLVTGSYTSRICLSLPDGEHYYRKAGTFSAGVATVTIDEQEAASVVGRSYGYIQLLSGSTVIASTASFPVLVLPDATADATVPESYDTAIQEAIDGLNEAVADLPETVEGILEQHTEWTTTVQDNSVTDAKLIQSGGILSRNQRLMYRLANLLTHRTDEGTLAAISDAAKTPMAGLSVYGQSTQDGTPTPEAPVPIVSVEGDSEGNISLRARGFNQFDPVNLKTGVFVNATRREIVSSSGTKTAVFEVFPNTDYCLTYDGNRCTIAGVDSLDIQVGDEARIIFDYLGEVSPKVFNSGDNRYVAAYLANADVEAANICINISDPSRNGEYAPYTATTTPIDLDGHELRSLPDGTRDELTVDAEGHVTLVQRVGAVTFDGSSDESWGGASNIPFVPLGVDAVNNIGICDHATQSAATSVGQFNIYKGSSYPSRFYFNIAGSGAMTVEQVKTWLAENPTTVLFKLVEPVTHDLGTVPLVPLVGPDLTAQTVPTAPFVLDAERDLNVTLARLESAIAALA